LIIWYLQIQDQTADKQEDEFNERQVQKFHPETNSK